MTKLFVTLEYPPKTGGIASFVYNLLARLPRTENIVWAPCSVGGEEFDLQSGIKTYRGQPYWFIWPHWLRLFFALYGVCKKESVDKIYVHHVLPVGYVAYLIKKIKRIPYTVFFHGTDLELAARHKKNKLLLICKEADEIIIHSNFMRVKVAAILGESAIKKFKIIYPCPGEKFLLPANENMLNKIRAELGLNGKKVIITVGRIEDGKGFTRLISLLPAILSRVPNAVLLIVGAGPKRENLISLTKKLGLQNAVRWLGEISYDNLPVYYQVSNLFVLLSHPDNSKEESWGTVFLEAAAAGLPTIAGRAGGVSETIEDNITGWLVDSSDKERTLAAIIKLLTDTELAQTMGAAGQERIKREFTWDGQVAKL